MRGGALISYTYLAHTLEDSDRTQPLLEHLVDTAELAKKFAQAFGAGSQAYRCALGHDIGKYADAAQLHLRGKAGRVDHSTAGALEMFRLRDIPAAFCIAGHHAGLPDMGTKVDAASTLSARLRYRAGKEIELYDAFHAEVKFPDAEIPQKAVCDPLDSFFFIHMLYSTLVDADWLDTEAFVSDGAVSRKLGESLEVLSQKLDMHVSQWWDATTELNRRRSHILKQLMDEGDRPRGIYTLTVPTGGGKTVSSMGFALRHALAHSNGDTALRRIIYVIPYTSIIEQTQEVFERIFGSENVIAHYANVDYPEDENGRISDVDKRRLLASENWDAPIILTTAVQFFESLFGNRSSRCRKLHNIANSVLIFDEAQMLPPDYLEPCVWAISQLVSNYGCTSVLCTATQPSLNPLIKKWIPEGARELCEDTVGNHEFFRRVDYQKEGVLSDEALAEKLSQEKQVLCIVNRRDQAQRLYGMLPEKNRFHLSTAMTAEHRRSILNMVQSLLDDGETCRVVSTSLIEAGVDVDFPSVYRAVAGLDSMIQAAGRCNRNGEPGARRGIVHLFDTERPSPRGMAQAIAAARRIMEQFEDIALPQAVKAYFDSYYYQLKDGRAKDAAEIMPLMQKLAFRTVADKFHLIDSAAFTVYVPRGEGRKLTNDFLNGNREKSLIRKMGSYAVPVYPDTYRAYMELGCITPISENAGVLKDVKTYYSEESGLSLNPIGGLGIFDE